MLVIKNVISKNSKEKNFSGGSLTPFHYVGNQTKSLFAYSYLPYSKIIKEREFSNSIHCK